MWDSKSQARVTVLKLMPYGVMEPGGFSMEVPWDKKCFSWGLGRGRTFQRRAQQLPALCRVRQAKTGAGNWVSHNPGEVFGFQLFRDDFLPDFFGPETSSWSWETFPSETPVEIDVFTEVRYLFFFFFLLKTKHKRPALLKIPRFCSPFLPKCALAYSKHYDMPALARKPLP